MDVHSAAQGIITLVETKDLSQDNVRLAGSVFRWSMGKLWNDRGYFYYQQRACCKVKIPYMRWGQAWMLLGLSVLLEALSDAEPDASGRRCATTGGGDAMNRESAESVSQEAGDRPARQYSYVLITPARNEAAFIEMTIKSVVAQTIRPLKWVIVSDGSTDGTDEIVRRYAEKHPWIELVRMPERQERHFAGKVHAFNAGYAQVKHLTYDLIGSMDADISFEPDYFSFLLERFAANPRLGLAGTPFQERGESYDFRFSSLDHVSGACQLFRRECFEAIGGYQPVKGGGINVIAALSARMKGWETRTFPERPYTHHRPMSAAKYGSLKARFKDGEKDYLLGGHPVWEIFRCLYQMGRRPLIIGGCVLLASYIWAAARRLRAAYAAGISPLPTALANGTVKAILWLAAANGGELEEVPGLTGHARLPDRRLKEGHLTEWNQQQN